MATFGKKWSNAELALLETTDDISELAILLPGRTLGAIRKKKLDMRSFSKEPWTEEEVLQFPAERVVNKLILSELANKLAPKSKDQIWKKMKSLGYIWDKDFQEEATDDNPYPDHGKKWTPEELALFPEGKLVNAEILEKVQALFPRRKPTSIWPKMKKEGYFWDKEEKPQLAMTNDGEIILAHTPQENFVLSLAYELGFRTPTRGSAYALEPYLNPTSNDRDAIASKFGLPEDFTSGELYYALGTRITPFPWEMEPIDEVATAYRNRDQKSIMEAAKALHSKLEKFING